MFFKKSKSDNKELLKICALLIHAAKIDENYTEKEEEIIKKTLEELGLEKNDINLNVSDNYIYLNYESTNEQNKPYWTNSFNRRIKLPNDIQRDSVEAELKNGILSIKIKKDSAKNSHKIKIK